MNWHSALKKEHGDAIINGASSTQHMEENMADLDKGPLPGEVVEALDQGWRRVKPICNNYWH